MYSVFNSGSRSQCYFLENLRGDDLVIERLDSLIPGPSHYTAFVAFNTSAEKVLVMHLDVWRSGIFWGNCK